MAAGEDVKELGEDASRGRGAPAQPATQPAERMQPLLGLAVALSTATVVLVYYHAVRPWLAIHHVTTKLPEDVAAFLKAVVAFSAFALAMWALLRRLSGRPFSRARFDSAAMVFASLSVVAFAISDDLRASSYIHRWEFFHYYIGSKYSEELGYERIYTCTAIAQSELGPAEQAEVMQRKIRNLRTDTVEPASTALDNELDCKSRFTPERWMAFRNDVGWFRGDVTRDYWDRMQRDHGYNPPPLWTMSGRFFSSFFPEGASLHTLLVLASLGPIVYALTFFFVWWAFGARTCCLVLIYWGTQYPAGAYFTGGGYLREDWLLFLVLAACLLRKHYWALAGAALATSTLLRIFPVIFFAGIAVVAGTYWLEHRRFAKEHLRVFAGAALASVVLVSASAAALGPHTYVEFAKHIQLHKQNPTTNYMGIPFLLTFSVAGRSENTLKAPVPWDELGGWPQIRKATYERRRPLGLAITALVVAFFVWTVRRVKTLWIAMALSTALVVTLLPLSCYYYSFFIVLALLAKASLRVGRGMILAAGISAILFVWPRISNNWDDRYTVQSLVFVCLALAVLAGFNKRWSLRRAPVGARA